jgi:hypothetical protein
VSSTIWLIRLILGCPIGLYHLNYNFTTFFSILVRSILLHGQTVVIIFLVTLKKYWIPTLSSRISFVAWSFLFFLQY